MLTLNGKIALGILLFMACALLAVGLRQPVQAAPPAQLTLFPTPTPGSDGRIRYIVKEGDTLWRIAAISGVSLDDLRTLNKLGADEVLTPGMVLVIGLAGPALETATVGPSPTPLPQEPTPTSLAGTANLYVILYNDRNGDALRQAEEPVIPGGAISVSGKTSPASFTAYTAAKADPACPTELELDPGYICFMALPEGEYIVSVAIPDGYNPTTVLSRPIQFRGGDETYMSFGAQANTEKIAETAVIPESPGRSPLLAIVGGLILLIGMGLGIYAALLARKG